MERGCVGCGRGLRDRARPPKEGSEVPVDDARRCLNNSFEYLFCRILFELSEVISDGVQYHCGMVYDDGASRKLGLRRMK